MIEDQRHHVVLGASILFQCICIFWLGGGLAVGKWNFLQYASLLIICLLFDKPVTFEFLVLICVLLSALSLVVAKPAHKESSENSKFMN